MKVSFKIAECSLFGAKINKKHETHKRFRTFYMFLSIHCVEFLHLVMEHRSIEKTTSLCQRRHLFPFMLLQIQIKHIKYLTKIIIKHIIIYTTSQFFWHFHSSCSNSYSSSHARHGICITTKRDGITDSRSITICFEI